MDLNFVRYYFKHPQMMIGDNVYTEIEGLNRLNNEATPSGYGRLDSVSVNAIYQICSQYNIYHVEGCFMESARLMSFCLADMHSQQASEFLNKTLPAIVTTYKFHYDYWFTQDKDRNILKHSRLLIGYHGEDPDKETNMAGVQALITPYTDHELIDLVTLPGCPSTKIQRTSYTPSGRVIQNYFRKWRDSLGFDIPLNDEKSVPLRNTDTFCQATAMTLYDLSYQNVRNECALVQGNDWKGLAEEFDPFMQYIAKFFVIQYAQKQTQWKVKTVDEKGNIDFMPIHVESFRSFWKPFDTICWYTNNQNKRMTKKIPIMEMIESSNRITCVYGVVAFPTDAFIVEIGQSKYLNTGRRPKFSPTQVWSLVLARSEHDTSIFAEIVCFFLWHLYVRLCNYQTDMFIYLLDCFANMVMEEPGWISEKIISVYSAGKGTGKTIVGEILQEMMHKVQTARFTTFMDLAADRWSPDLLHWKLLFIDEVGKESGNFNKAAFHEKLKGIITGGLPNCNMKYSNIENVPPPVLSWTTGNVKPNFYDPRRSIVLEVGNQFPDLPAFNTLIALDDKKNLYKEGLVTCKENPDVLYTFFAWYYKHRTSDSTKSLLRVPNKNMTKYINESLAEVVFQIPYIKNTQSSTFCSLLDGYHPSNMALAVLITLFNVFITHKANFSDQDDKALGGILSYEELLEKAVNEGSISAGLKRVKELHTTTFAHMVTLNLGNNLSAEIKANPFVALPAPDWAYMLTVEYIILRMIQLVANRLRMKTSDLIDSFPRHMVVSALNRLNLDIINPRIRTDFCSASLSDRYEDNTYVNIGSREKLIQKIAEFLGIPETDAFFGFIPNQPVLSFEEIKQTIGYDHYIRYIHSINSNAVIID